MNQTSGRKEVKRLTGQHLGAGCSSPTTTRSIQGSKEIAAWAKAEPGYAARVLCSPPVRARRLRPGGGGP